MKHNIMALLMLMVTGSLNAQMLDSLVFAAYHNSEKLHALSIKREAVIRKSEGMEYLPAPTLGIEFSQVPVGSVNIINEAISNSISLSQMFPIGGKLAAMAAAERKMLNVIDGEIHAEKQKITASLAMQYAGLYAVEKKIQVQSEINRVLQQIVSGYQFSIAAGGTHADFYMATALLETGKLRLQEMNREKEGSVSAIRKESGYIGTIQLDISDSKIIKHSYAGMDELDSLLCNNPELQQMAGMAAMKEAEQAAMQKELIPDLMVQGMIMRMPQGMLLTSGQSMSMLSGKPTTEYMYSIMASITLPFAPWAQNGIVLKSEALQLEAKQYHLERAGMIRNMRSRLQVTMAKRDASLQKAIAYTEKVIPSLKLAELSAAQAYAAGSYTLSQYYQYVNMRAMEEMNYYMAVADILMNEAEINMMTSGNLFYEMNR